MSEARSLVFGRPAIIVPVVDKCGSYTNRYPKNLSKKPITSVIVT